MLGLWRIRLPGRTDERGAVAELHRRVAAAGFDVPLRLWDGTVLGAEDRGYTLVLRYPWSLRSMLVPLTDLAAGEAYVRDDIDVEGSMLAALRDIARHREALTSIDRRRLLTALLRLPPPPEQTGLRRARLRGRPHSPDRDASVVRFHYDVGNDFYRVFLDENLVYSCAYFTDDDDDLARAQIRKVDLVCGKFYLRAGERLLDVGCGWGALVIHAARHYGVHAVGITLSEPQAELARERAAAAGVADRVEIRVEDYRGIRGSFDAVASIGMVEHVGADHLADYFRTCYRLTAPGGRFLNHGITTGQRNIVRDYARDRRTFVGTHVFPDGALVPAHVAVRHLEEAGFELHDVEQLRPHYARTLTHWVARLEAGTEIARAAASEQIYRVWRAYMAGAVVGFETGRLGVIQALGVRGAVLPLGREWMIPQVDGLSRR